MPTICDMTMPGQPWPGTAVSFLGMWVVMMVPMMLPVLIPMLRRYREALLTAGEARVDRSTALAGIGYFLVWTVVGVGVLLFGVACAAIEAWQPALTGALPIAAAMIVVIAGTVQFTRWKARRLACCKEAGGLVHTLPPETGAALRHGVRLGLLCGQCCGNLMVILLAAGLMDGRAMIAVTAAIAAERLTPAGERVARAIGAAAVVAGLVLVARAA